MDTAEKNPVTTQRYGRREFLGEMARVAASSFLGYKLVRSFIWNIPTTEKSTLPESLIYEPSTPITDSEGRSLELVGVTHSHPNLLKNYQDIEKRVAKSSVVFLEYFQKHERDLALPESDFRAFHPQTVSESTNLFFAGVGHLCAKHGKDVVVVNPETAIVQEMEIYQLFGLASAAIVEWSMPKRIKMTRRQVLKWAATIATAASWASITGATAGVRNVLEGVGILTSDLPEEEQANLLGYGLMDWRDVKSAWGINRVIEQQANEIGPHTSMAMFQGARHSRMIEYLKDPKLLKTKIEFYQLHNRLGQDSSKIYTFNQSRNSWELKSEVPY